MYSFEPFSKRVKRRVKLDVTDVYQYDELPTTFRVQVIHIWNDALGNYSAYDQVQHSYVTNFLWGKIYRIKAT